VARAPILRTHKQYICSASSKSMTTGRVEEQLMFLNNVLQQAENQLCSLRSSRVSSSTLKRTRMLEQQAKEVMRSFIRFDSEFAEISSEVLRHLSAVDLAKEASSKLESTSIPRSVHGYRMCGSTIPSVLPSSLFQQFFVSMDALCTWQERQVCTNISDFLPTTVQGVEGEVGTLVEAFQAYLKKLAYSVN
jgi:hypothetical protein